MTVAARKMDIRCFLEGVEVPCVSAAMQINYDAPATCSVQCIPTPSCTRLKPRTSLHVFYRDLSKPNQNSDYKLYFMGEIVSYQWAKTPTSLSIVYQALDDSSYWDTAYQYFTDYGRGSDWLYRSKSKFMGTGLGLFDSIFREHASVIGGLLRTSSKTYPNLRGLAGGVVHVLEAVGGVQGRFNGFNDYFTMAEMRRKILAQISASEADDTSVRIYSHKVFWQWILRQLGSVGSMVSIRDMVKLIFKYVFHNIIPNPIAKYDSVGDTDIRIRRYRLANTKKGKEILSVLDKVERNLTNCISAADRAFHVLVDAAISLETQVKRAGKRRGGKLPNSAITTTSNRVRTVHPAVRSSYVRLRNRFRQTQKEALIAITKSVPSLQGRVAAIENNINLAHEIAIDRVQRRLESRIIDSKISTEGLRNKEIFNLLAQMYAPSEDSNDVSRLQTQTTGYRIESRNRRPQTYVEKALAEVRAMKQELGGKVATARKDYTRRDRVHNQIIRPDIWFAAPPRCNVLFPDDYIQFNYSRSFLQEVTRMELTTSMELIGSNRVTNSRYFAPNIQDVTGEYVLSSARSGVRLIMPHEIYTGILPKFEFMSEANIFAATASQKRAEKEQKKQIIEQQKYLREQLSALKSNATLVRNNTDVIQQYEERIKSLEQRAQSVSSGGIPYIQRAVNFLYFKNRFASRSVTTTSNFLYRVVSGFPGLVIHRPPVGSDDKPPQFLGMVAGLSHSISQGGGVTNITFSHAREHGGADDEFLSIDGGAKQNVQTGRTVVTRLRTGTVNGALGRKQKRINSLSNIKAQSARTKSQIRTVQREKKKIEKNAQFIIEVERRRKSGKPLTGFRGPNGGIVVQVQRGGSSFKLPQQRGNSGNKLSQTGSIIGVGASGLPVGLDYAQTYKITERFPTIRRTLNLPPEEQLYPTWLSPIYRNENIGKEKIRDRFGPYFQFFGCKAITDDPLESPDTRLLYERALKDKDLTILGKALPAKTIEESVDELVQVYDTVRKNGLDVRSFIDNYTIRPVASLTEIMGTPDLRIDESGSVIQGYSGFHSFAFGDFENLQGFNNERRKSILSKSKTSKVARQMDTRKAKYDAVLAYRQELDKGPGFLGG
jgi:hypothetical protein